MKNKLIISFLCYFASNAFADTTQDLFWPSGTKNLHPIQLPQQHTPIDNLIYSYKENCSDQQPEQGNSNKVIFDCTMDDGTNELTIELRDGAIGKGKIEIQIIGIDNNNKVIDYKTITYNVTVFNPAKLTVTAPAECPNWSCNLDSGFYMGYEGTSVSDVEEKGNIRFQYGGYAQFAPFDHVHIHMLGDLMQTSLQEQVAAKPECQNTGSSENEDDASPECEVEPTIAGNVGIFMPIYWKEKAQLDPGKIIMGPMAEYSIRKLESADEFVPSYYLNYRLAYSKIRFFSLGYGKSEGIPGGRIKINGQIPIYEEKLLAGFTLNMAADNEAKQNGLNPGDSINIYILTEIDFGEIFTSFKQ
jgi:hypothetical protein